MWTRALMCLTLLAGLAAAFGSTRPADPPKAVNVFEPTPPGSAERQLQAVLKELRVELAPFEMALEGLRDAARLNLVVDWQSLAAEGIHRDTPVSVRLDNATAAEAL